VDVAWYVFTTLYCLFALGWLLLGLAAALTAHVPGLNEWAHAAAWGKHGQTWMSLGACLVVGARHSYPPGDVVLDYIFSGVNLLFAAILFRLARHDWTVRFLVIGMVGSAGAFNLQAHTSIDAMAQWTGVQIDLWHVALLHGVGGVAYVLALLLFPTGTLDWGGHRKWPVRVLLITSVAGAAALLSVSTAEAPHTISFVLFFGLLIPVAGVTAQLARYRRATNSEARQQSRVVLWALGLSFAAALVLTVITLITQTGHVTLVGMPGMRSDFPGLERLNSPVTFWIFRAIFTMIPIAIMVGVLHFRLWDVERLFNRTLIYGALLAMIGTIYVFGVVRTDRWLGLSTSTGWASIVASGLIAFAFQPARALVGRWADRLVYGKRKPRYDVLAEVQALVQASEPGAAALGSLARIVAQGLATGSASVVLDLPDGTSDIYRWPAGEPGPEPAGEWWIPVGYRGEHVGALCLPGSQERRLAPDRRALLGDLADSVGVILHNASLSIQLEHSLRAVEARSAELRASRWRIVAAQDGERRDLERDLHDGAQPSLTAVRVTLGLVSHMGRARNIAGARRALGQLQGQITDALARLSQTLRGLDPRIASLPALLAALREEAAVLGARAVFRFTDGEATALDPVVGAAVYFCCTEALQNTVKHCPDAPVEVRADLEADARRVRFSVTDSGPGFDIRAVPPGGGLQNMADRIGAVGGDLTVTTEPGRGTTVAGWVPVALPALTPAGAAAPN
jgi:signal transduction histidine kinase